MDGFAFQVEVFRTNRKKPARIRFDEVLSKSSVPRSLSDNYIPNLIWEKTSQIKTNAKSNLNLPLVYPKEHVREETFL